MFFVTHKSNAKMMTQFRKGMDALATYAGKEFGGVAGPMPAKAIRIRNKPLDDEPATPEGLAATPGSVDMIKWKIEWEDWTKKDKNWREQTSPRIFNLVWAHTAEDMRAQLEGRPEWQETLAEQNVVELLKLLYALHHKKDDTRPSMLEVVGQDRQLYLCTQREPQSDVDFTKMFKNAIDTINDSGGMTGATVCGLNLICQEQGINYAALPPEIEQDGEMIPNSKKAAVNAEAQERYLAALVASALHNKRHRRLKNKVKNLWVTQKLDILPKNLTELHKMIKGYVDDKATRGRPRCDPNEAGVALVGTGERRQRNG